MKTEDELQTGEGTQEVLWRSPWFWAALTFSALTGLLYYVVTLALRTEPFSVTVFYRHLDAEYFSTITRQFGAHFGDYTLKETFRQGVEPFPVLGFLPYSLGHFFFGLAGFPVVDVAICMARWLAFLALVRLFVRESRTAISLALVLFCLTSEPVLRLWPPLRDIGVCAFWTYRIPRDFLTSIFNLWGLYGLLRVLRVLLSGAVVSAKAAQRDLVILAIGFVLIMNGDIYMGVLFGFAVGTLFLLDLFLSRLGWRNWLLFGSVQVLGNLSFAYQLSHTLPDVRQRLGSYLLPDTLVLASRASLPVVGILLCVLAVAALCYRQNRSSPNPVASGTMPLHQGLLGLALLQGWALIAGFMFMSVTRHGIQEYHFPRQAEQLAGLGVAVLLVVALYQVGRFLGHRRSLPWVAVAVAIGTGGAHFLFHKARAHFEASPIHSGEALPGYRQQFSALVRELDRPVYPRGGSLASLDYSSAKWWVTFREGFFFLPDTCWSLVSDAMIEERVMRYLHLTGVNREGWAALLDDPIFLVRFISMGKYQNNRFHSFAPLEDYDIKAIGAYYRGQDNWLLALPRSERERLLAAFATDTSAAVPDVVVINKKQWALLQPDTKLFARTYTNEIFDVYLRRP